MQVEATLNTNSGFNCMDLYGGYVSCGYLDMPGPFHLIPFDVFYLFLLHQSPSPVSMF